VILKPGQQATSGEDISVKSNVDIDQTLAWKNGLFNFNGLNVREVMRQLERWYDIKIKFEGDVSSLTFRGEMFRDVNLSDVLEMFQKLEVKFRMEGKTLIVTGE
jgi:ferric-dicitrate binding protein FerR (iron transport regulator)